MEYGYIEFQQRYIARKNIASWYIPWNPSYSICGFDKIKSKKKGNGVLLS
jgi:hypothetical protein